jgi:hypothetical protein
MISVFSLLELVEFDSAYESLLVVSSKGVKSLYPSLNGTWHLNA